MSFACGRALSSADSQVSGRGSRSSTSTWPGPRWICCNRVPAHRPSCSSDNSAHERSLAALLADNRFDTVDVDSRIERQTALATDPLAVVTLLILTASALVALSLGGCAVMSGAAADVSDDRPLLRVLALERVRGRRLVAMVAGKSIAAVLIVIPLGVIGGRWLLQIATRLVAVSATSGRPTPPLRLAVPWTVVVLLSLALMCVLAVGAVLGAIRARRVPDEDASRSCTS